ncbi:MAG: FMN-binding negative transcriptional regulator [Burkholderiaceae bacterium]
MYLPSHFASEDPAFAIALVDDHPFATVALSDAEGLLVDHLPVIRDPASAGLTSLIGHVARANPLWRRLSAAGRALVVFQGEQRYISPSWYASKASDGQVVPTWNYALAHVQVGVRCIDDADGKLAIVTALTERFERPRAQPWAVHDAPAAYIEKRLAGIVGLRLAVLNVTVKAKLSQNQPAGNRASLVAGLEREGDHAMADAIRRAAPTNDRR